MSSARADLAARSEIPESAQIQEIFAVPFPRRAPAASSDNPRMRYAMTVFTSAGFEQGEVRVDLHYECVHWWFPEVFPRTGGIAPRVDVPSDQLPEATAIWTRVGGRKDWNWECRRDHPRHPNSNARGGGGRKLSVARGLSEHLRVAHGERWRWSGDA